VGSVQARKRLRGGIDGCTDGVVEQRCLEAYVMACRGLYKQLEC
jgi:hypothetical protein